MFTSTTAIIWAVIGRDIAVGIRTGAHIEMAWRYNVYLNFPNRRASESKYLMDEVRNSDASPTLKC